MRMFSTNYISILYQISPYTQKMLLRSVRMKVTFGHYPHVLSGKRRAHAAIHHDFGEVLGRVVQRMRLLLNPGRAAAGLIACFASDNAASIRSRSPGPSASAVSCSKSAVRSVFSVALMTVSASLRASMSRRASKSASACSNDSISIRSTSSSVSPYDGLTSIVCSMPVRSSRGDAQDAVRVDLEPHLDARQAGRPRRNAAQVEPRERAAVGGQLALALQHVDVDAVWLSTADVNISRPLAGIVELRRMIFDTTPPIVSMPSDSGVTSSSSISRRPLTRMSAWKRGAERHDLVRIQLAVRVPVRTARGRGGARAGCASTRRPAPPHRCPSAPARRRQAPGGTAPASDR